MFRWETGYCLTGISLLVWMLFFFIPVFFILELTSAVVHRVPERMQNIQKQEVVII